MRQQYRNSIVQVSHVYLGYAMDVLKEQLSLKMPTSRSSVARNL